MPWADGDRLNSTNLNSKIPSWVSSLASGTFGQYRVRDYGAVGDGVTDDVSAIQSAISAAAGNGPVIVSAGTYSCSTSLRLPSNTVLMGEGWQSVLSFGYTDTGAPYYVRNADQTGSGNSNIQIRDLWIRRSSGGTRTSGSAKPGGIHLKYVTDFEVSGVRVDNSPSVSIAYQGCQRGRILGNEIRNSEVDGITGWWNIEDVVVANNVIMGLGDDGIALQATSSDNQSNTTGARRVAIVGNVIFGQSQYTSPAAGRGIVVVGADGVSVAGNSIASTFAAGILLEKDPYQSLRPQNIALTGNSIIGAGTAGDNSQPGIGIRVGSSDRVTIDGNVVSLSSRGGIALVDSRYVSVIGNSVSSNGTSATDHFGIDVGGSLNSFVNISGNQVSGNAGAGVVLNGTQFFTVTGNTVVNNARQGDGTAASDTGIYLLASLGPPMGTVTGNVVTDTAAVGSKKQAHGLRGVSLSAATLLVTGNSFSGNSGVPLVSGSPTRIQWWGNDSDITFDITDRSLSASTVDASVVQVTKDGALAVFQATAFADQPQFIGRRAQGTQSSPTAAVLDNVLATLIGRGYTGSAYSIAAAVTLSANTNFSANTATGAILFQTVSIGTTALQTWWRVLDSGALQSRLSAPFAPRTDNQSMTSSIMTTGEMAFGVSGNTATMYLRFGGTLWGFPSSTSTVG